MANVSFATLKVWSVGIVCCVYTWSKPTQAQEQHANTTLNQQISSQDLIITIIKTRHANLPAVNKLKHSSVLHDGGENIEICI